MQWCTYVGNILWALLTIPLCLPFSLILLLFAAICGLCGEFLLWVLPSMVFPKGLISVGNNLISSAKKILGWSLPMILFEHAARREEQRGGATIQTFNPMETQRVSIRQSTLTENENVIFGFPKIGFTYEELTVACNGFSDSTFIGKGGFGSVHKGGLDDGREIAIKQINADSRCGDRDFIAEIDVLSRVHHRHLVQLIGCCITKESKMLVCEYVPNKTLEFHLHKRSESLVDWSTRLKIAIGSAKALSYLHEDCQPRIIHGDIKAANILLENSFEAKVADFGLARFFPDGETHVYVTQVVGTRGYLAPEYASTGEIREQSDTYSYGVVLLELITGKTPLIRTDSRVECLVDWARELLLQALVDHNYHDIVDPRLANNYNSEEMKLMVACASACVRRSLQARPPMSQVVLVLEGIATPDTLGDEPIQSSGDLTSGSLHSMSGYTTTDDTTTDISMNLETEYITAYINSTTSEQIPHHVASMNQTVSQDERPECVDFPTDEIVSRGTMTAVVPRIDDVGREIERSSMNMLLSGENSEYLTNTANQAHSLNTEYITADISSV